MKLESNAAVQCDFREATSYLSQDFKLGPLIQPSFGMHLSL